MDKLTRNATLAQLITSLKEKGSWCGETHIQKAVYFLQELAGIDLGFNFIMYKHGPYSFELTDELTSMRADGLLRIELQPAPYGPSLIPTEGAVRLMKLYPKTLDRYREAIEKVAEIIGDKRVADLERFATALFATRTLGEGGQASVEHRAQLLNKLKPHVSLPDARTAVEEIDKWIAQFTSPVS